MALDQTSQLERNLELANEIKKKIEFVGPGNSPEAQDKFASNLSLVASSKGSTGFSLMSKFLCEDGTKRKVHFADGVGPASVKGNLYLDPKGWSIVGDREMSFKARYTPIFHDDIVLAHEIGHIVLGLNDPHNLAVENAYRNETGMRPRAYYRDKYENPLYSSDRQGSVWRGSSEWPWNQAPEDFLKDTVAAGKAVRDLRKEWGGSCCK